MVRACLRAPTTCSWNPTTQCRRTREVFLGRAAPRPGGSEVLEYAIRVAPSQAAVEPRERDEDREAEEENDGVAEDAPETKNGACRQSDHLIDGVVGDEEEERCLAADDEPGKRDAPEQLPSGEEEY